MGHLVRRRHCSSLTDPAALLHSVTKRDQFLPGQGTVVTLAGSSRGHHSQNRVTAMYSPELLPSPREATLPPFGFDNASPSLEGLFGMQATESFDPGQAVFWEGDAAGYVFHLLEGCLRIYRTSPDGRRAILGFIYPGDVLGVSFRDRYSFTAEAVRPVKLRRFPRRRFHQLVDEASHLRPQLLAKICDETNA